MAQGNYLGRGPSKKILDERQISKQIELIKNTAFTREDLKRNFKSLGLPTPEYLDEEEFLQSSQERNIVRDEYVADQNSTHTFKRVKTPTKKEVTPKRKPGRPPGSVRKELFSKYQTNSGTGKKILFV